MVPVSGGMPGVKRRLFMSERPLTGHGVNSDEKGDTR